MRLVERAVSEPSSAISLRSQKWLAALLSLAVPGLGQVFQGRIRRGLILFPLPAVAIFAFCHSGALREFTGAVMLLLVEIVLWTIVIVDAFFSTSPSPLPSRRHRIIAAAILFLASLTATSTTGTDFLMGNIRIFEVTGVAMTPALAPGDWVVVSIEPWMTQPLGRGAIVAFRHRGQTYARRIIGLQDDTIAFQGGRIQRNGQRLNEPYADLSPIAGVVPDQLLPVRVPSGQVYLLGDARNRSIDSHTAGYGPVSTGDILGPALYVLWSDSLARTGKRVQ